MSLARSKRPASTSPTRCAVVARADVAGLLLLVLDVHPGGADSISSQMPAARDSHSSAALMSPSARASFAAASADACASVMVLSGESVVS